MKFKQRLVRPTPQADDWVWEIEFLNAKGGHPEFAYWSQYFPTLLHAWAARLLRRLEWTDV